MHYNCAWLIPNIFPLFSKELSQIALKADNYAVYSIIATGGIIYRPIYFVCVNMYATFRATQGLFIEGLICFITRLFLYLPVTKQTGYELVASVASIYPL